MIYFGPYRYHYSDMPVLSEKSPFYMQGLCFACTRCSACCRFESGYVFLSGKDVSLLGEALSMAKKEFIETYCRWIPSGNGVYQLSLKEKSNYDCIFWMPDKDPSLKGGCSVYNSRPLQCRAFPFWSSVVCNKKSWEMTARDCPGINHGVLHSRDSIEKWLALRKTEPIITRGDL